MPADQQRPPSVGPHFWWKVLSVAQRSQWWKENREELAKASDPADSGANNAATGEIKITEGVIDDDGPIGDELWEQWAMITDMYIDLSLYLLSVIRVVVPPSILRCRRKPVLAITHSPGCPRDLDVLGNIGRRILFLGTEDPIMLWLRDLWAEPK